MNQIIFEGSDLCRFGTLNVVIENQSSVIYFRDDSLTKYSENKRFISERTIYVVSFADDLR